MLKTVCLLFLCLGLNSSFLSAQVFEQEIQLITTHELKEFEKIFEELYKELTLEEENLSLTSAWAPIQRVLVKGVKLQDLALNVTYFHPNAIMKATALEKYSSMQTWVNVFKTKYLYGEKKEQSLSSAEVMEMEKELNTKIEKYQKNITEKKAPFVFSGENLDERAQEALKDFKNKNDTTYAINMANFFHRHATFSFCNDREVRKKLYQTYSIRGLYPENKDLLKEILILRSRIARKYGFKTWAHYKFSGDATLGDPKKVAVFLNNRLKELSPFFLQELAEIQRETPFKVRAWDYDFLKKQKEKVEYIGTAFEVLTFAFDYLEQKKIIKVKKVEGKIGWHPNVSFYEIYNITGDILLGYFFLDLSSPEFKFKNPCVNCIMPTHWDAEENKIIPAFLTLSLPYDLNQNLNRFERTTVWHELGHVLEHSLGSQLPYNQTTSYAGATLLVEAVSTLFERLAQHDLPIEERELSNFKNKVSTIANYLVSLKIALWDEETLTDPHFDLVRELNQISFKKPFDKKEELAHFFFGMSAFVRDGYGPKYFTYDLGSLFADMYLPQLEEKGYHPEAFQSILEIIKGGAPHFNKCLEEMFK
ncbi:MAG: hypothetical protein KBD63_04090 [Bacteriovoracaceae bacterium]|nr:hypothetical protein [Bacteriovoracaceae bacterium]